VHGVYDAQVEQYPTYKTLDFINIYQAKGANLARGA